MVGTLCVRWIQDPDIGHPQYQPPVLTVDTTTLYNQLGLPWFESPNCSSSGVEFINHHTDRLVPHQRPVPKPLGLDSPYMARAVLHRQQHLTGLTQRIRHGLTLVHLPKCGLQLVVLLMDRRKS